MPAPFPEAISRFCNTRSFSGGHFQGPLYFLNFRLPRPPKWRGNPTKARKSSILQYPLLFRSPFQGRLDFLDFWLPRPPKWVEHHTSTKNVDFAIPALFRNFQGPLYFLDFRLPSRRTGGNTTKVPKLSILQYPLLFLKLFPRHLGFLDFRLP